MANDTKQKINKLEPSIKAGKIKNEPKKITPKPEIKANAPKRTTSKGKAVVVRPLAEKQVTSPLYTFESWFMLKKLKVTWFKPLQVYISKHYPECQEVPLAQWDKILKKF